MKQEALFYSTVAVRERYCDEYWRKRDPIADDRLLWRAQTFRHTVHLLPGQTILELGCGEGLFTHALLQVSRGENRITTVTFQEPARVPSDIRAEVEPFGDLGPSQLACRSALRLRGCNGPSRPELRFAAPRHPARASCASRRDGFLRE